MHRTWLLAVVLGALGCSRLAGCAEEPEGVDAGVDAGVERVVARLPAPPVTERPGRKLEGQYLVVLAMRGQGHPPPEVPQVLWSEPGLTFQRFPSEDYRGLRPCYQVLTAGAFAEEAEARQVVERLATLGVKARVRKAGRWQDADLVDFEVCEVKLRWVESFAGQAWLLLNYAQPLMEPPGWSEEARAFVEPQERAEWYRVRPGEEVVLYDVRTGRSSGGCRVESFARITRGEVDVRPELPQRGLTGAGERRPVPWASVGLPPEVPRMRLTGAGQRRRGPEPQEAAQEVTPEREEAAEREEAPLQAEAPMQAEAPVQAEAPLQAEAPVQAEAPGQGEDGGEEAAEVAEEAREPTLIPCGMAGEYARLSCRLGPEPRVIAVPASAPPLRFYQEEPVGAELRERMQRVLREGDHFVAARTWGREWARAQGTELSERLKLRGFRRGEALVVLAELRLWTGEGQDACEANDYNKRVLVAWLLPDGQWPQDDEEAEQIFVLIARGQSEVVSVFEDTHGLVRVVYVDRPLGNERLVLSSGDGTATVPLERPVCTGC